MNELTDATKKVFTKRKATNIDKIYAEQGKLPPQALDLEESVLGALMLEKDALTAVIDILRAECFYKDAHRLIFQAVISLFNKSQPIDILTVTNQLRQSGDLEIVGGPFYITQLTNRVASTAHIEAHSRIIIQKYIQRELIRISSQIIREAYEDTNDILDLLDKAEKDLFSVTEGNIRKSFDKMSNLIIEVKKNIDKARNQEGVVGVPSGFTALDKVTSGWQKTDLIIVAARPGMGKTAYVLSLARNAAIEFNKPVAVFSLEMSSVQLVTRLIASETGITFDKLKKGDLQEHEWEQLNSQISSLSEAPIFIDDTTALSVFELRAKCRRLKAQHDIQMVIIDYLQLMTGSGSDKGSGNREQEISMISRSLKGIAKELDIPVIALSQLNRSVETRGGAKRPQLSDLRESGAIEQDADMVQFIYRPEYYGLLEDENQNSTRGMAEIIIAKHRNGKTDTVNLGFVQHLAKFTDLEYSSNNLENAFSSITVESKINQEDDMGGYQGLGYSNNNDDVPF